MDTQSGELGRWRLQRTLLTLFDAGRRYSLHSIVVFSVAGIVYFCVQRASYLIRIDQLEKTIETIKVQDERIIDALKEELQTENNHNEQMVQKHSVEIHIYELQLELERTSNSIAR